MNGQLTFANIKKHIAAPLANTEIYTTNDDGKSLEDVFGEMTASKFIIETMPIDFIYTVDRVLQEEAAAVADAGVPLTAAELGKLRKKLASERQNGLENDNVQDESSVW